MIPLIPKHDRLGKGFSKNEVLKSQIHPGRNVKAGQSAASWIVDLTSLRKPVLLCTFCRGKFDASYYNYRRYFSPDLSGKSSGFVVNGRCDACKEETANTPGGGTMFICEETYHLNCIDPSESRRRARQAWRGSQTAWAMIRKGQENGL